MRFLSRLQLHEVLDCLLANNIRAGTSHCESCAGEDADVACKIGAAVAQHTEFSALSLKEALSPLSTAAASLAFCKQLLPRLQSFEPVYRELWLSLESWLLSFAGLTQTHLRAHDSSCNPDTAPRPAATSAALADALSFMPQLRNLYINCLPGGFTEGVAHVFAPAVSARSLLTMLSLQLGVSGDCVHGTERSEPAAVLTLHPARLAKLQALRLNAGYIRATVRRWLLATTGHLPALAWLETSSKDVEPGHACRSPGNPGRFKLWDPRNMPLPQSELRRVCKLVRDCGKAVHV